MFHINRLRVLPTKIQDYNTIPGCHHKSNKKIKVVESLKNEGITSTEHTNNRINLDFYLLIS